MHPKLATSLAPGRKNATKKKNLVKPNPLEFAGTVEVGPGATYCDGQSITQNCLRYLECTLVDREYTLVLTNSGAGATCKGEVDSLGAPPQSFRCITR